MLSAVKTVYEKNRRFDSYVFLDRDGVINVETGDYTTTREQWEWAPGALDGIRRLTDAGYGIIVITNQACIARGIQTEEGLLSLHRYMADTVRGHGGVILAVYHCPHWTPDKCGCRKPEPGMILRAADDYGIDIARTFFIGDAPRDMEAGRRAGTRTIFIEGSAANGEEAASIRSDFRAGNLREAAEIVIREGEKAKKTDELIK